MSVASYQHGMSEGVRSYETLLPDWRERLVWSECGGREFDFVESATPRWAVRSRTRQPMNCRKEHPGRLHKASPRSIKMTCIVHEERV
jgi:hypothetical protein